MKVAIILYKFFYSNTKISYTVYVWNGQNKASTLLYQTYNVEYCFVSDLVSPTRGGPRLAVVQD